MRYLLLLSASLAMPAERHWQDGAKLDLERMAMNPRILLKDVVRLLTATAQARSVRVHGTVDERVPACIMADPARIRQVLINLGGNAVKFTERGEIGLSFNCESGFAEFVVHDTGIGIRPEHLQRVFDPFWQAEQSRTRRAEGTGLGLSVARRLAHLLKGDILAQSHAGEGARFILRIPAYLNPDK